GPARLLGLERGHLNGKFCRTLDILEILEFPAFKLRAVGEISVFGECVVLPAASIFNGLASPHSGCAVEIEEDMTARASTMLKNEMSVEQNRLVIGQERVIAIQVCPAGLHHADLGIGEVMDDPHEPVR